MKRKAGFLSFLFLITIMFLISHLNKTYILKLTNLSNKKIYDFKLVDNSFSLGYTHSVMKTEVEEFFIIENNKIKLIKTEYSSYGVGLPFFPEEGSLEIKEGKMILKTDRSFKNINMVISPIAKHYLKVNGKKYNLSDDILGDKPTKISITIK